MEISTFNRPTVINYELSLALSDYLKFGHRFRHMYSGELDRDRLYNLAINISDTLNDFKKQINVFMSSIQKT